MRAPPVLFPWIFALILTGAILSGCLQEPSDAYPAQHSPGVSTTTPSKPYSSPPPGNNSTGNGCGMSTCEEPEEAPEGVDHEVILDETRKYVNRSHEDSALFRVKNGTTRIEIVVYVNATDLGPYFVFGQNLQDSQDKPAAKFEAGRSCFDQQQCADEEVPPPIVMSFEEPVFVADHAGQPIYDPLRQTVKTPKASLWLAYIVGMGENVSVKMVVTAYYTEPAGGAGQSAGKS